MYDVFRVVYDFSNATKFLTLSLSLVPHSIPSSPPARVASSLPPPWPPPSDDVHRHLCLARVATSLPPSDEAAQRLSFYCRKRSASPHPGGGGGGVIAPPPFALRAVSAMYRRLRKRIMAVAQRSGGHGEHGCAALLPQHGVEEHERGWRYEPCFCSDCGRRNLPGLQSLIASRLARSGHALATHAISQAPRIPYHQTASPVFSSSSVACICCQEPRPLGTLHPRPSASCHHDRHTHRFPVGDLYDALVMAGLFWEPSGTSCPLRGSTPARWSNAHWIMALTPECPNVP